MSILSNWVKKYHKYKEYSRNIFRMNVTVETFYSKSCSFYSIYEFEGLIYDLWVSNNSSYESEFSVYVSSSIFIGWGLNVPKYSNVF